VHPARIYLGDSGALFLGSVLAVLTIRLNPSTENSFSGWILVFLLLAVPILDTSVVVASRLSQRISPFQGGRDHISHRLQDLGLTKKVAVLLIWLLQLYFCILAVLLFTEISNRLYFIELVAGFSWLALFFLFLRYLPIRMRG